MWLFCLFGTGHFAFSACCFDEVNKGFESFITKTSGFSEPWQTPFCSAGTRSVALHFFYH